MVPPQIFLRFESDPVRSPSGQGANLPLTFFPVNVPSTLHASAGGTSHLPRPLARNIIRDGNATIARARAVLQRRTVSQRSSDCAGLARLAGRYRNCRGGP